MKEKLSTEPYKGVRDFYPEDMAALRYIFDTMARVAESFGYSEYGASPLEPSELYQKKTSEEIVNEQTYTFTDRGDRSVTLRPEMTPTLARMVAGKRHDLVFPLRWYSIPNLFRYERPQRGRTREHYQLNADIFGVSDLSAEVEIMSLVSAVMKAFGAEESDFEIRINDRNILNSIFSELGVDEETAKRTMQLLDRRAKIENFDTELKALLGEKAAAFTEKLDMTSSSAGLEAIIKNLSDLGVKNAVVDTSIVRGFDYYTGVVFEVFDTSPENSRSLFGGGRYDNLLELFGGEKIPAVGFGMGDVTIRDFLETHNLLPEYESRTDLFLATLNEDAKLFAQKLAAELRAEDVNVEVSLSDKRVGEQIKIVDKKRIPFVIVIGEDEMKTNMFTVKQLATGAEAEVARDSIADYIFEKAEI